MGKRRLEESRAGRESSTLAMDSRGNWAIAEERAAREMEAKEEP